MKITDLKATPNIGPFGWTLLRIDSDEGISGYGEMPLWSTVRPNELADVRAALVGRRPHDVDPLIASMAPGLLHLGNSGLIHGVEMALLDLAGKAIGVPVYVLLGGKYRDRIRMYSDSHAGVDWDRQGFAAAGQAVRDTGQALEQYSPAAYAHHAIEVKGQGFTAVKFDIDFPTPHKRDWVDRSISPAELRGIIDVIAAIREAIGPDMDLAIDCHARYNTADALRIAYEVEPFHLMWLEDPVPPDNIEAMAKVTAQSRVPICTGEMLVGRSGFRELLIRQAADIVQPDVPRAGGPRELKKIADLADLYYTSIGPHCMASPVGTMAAAHLCAAVPNFLALEYHCDGIPFWQNLVKRPRPIIDGGCISVPEEPGLGIELDEDEIARHIDGPLWR